MRRKAVLDNFFCAKEVECVAKHGIGRLECSQLYRGHLRSGIGDIAAVKQ
jgi:hypothetical protein